MNFATNYEIIQANPLTGIKATFKKENIALKRMEFKDRLVACAMRSIASTILNENG